MEYVYVAYTLPIVCDGEGYWSELVPTSCAENWVEWWDSPRDCNKNVWLVPTWEAFEVASRGV